MNQLNMNDKRYLPIKHIAGRLRCNRRAALMMFKEFED